MKKTSIPHVDDLKSRKDKALELLSPLGFEDIEHGGNAASSIYHPAIGAIDISYLHPEELIQAIYDIGFRRGEENIKERARRLFGISQ